VGKTYPLDLPQKDVIRENKGDLKIGGNCGKTIKYLALTEGAQRADMDSLTN